MVNSWSLLYDEIYGDDEMNDDTKVTSFESDEYDPKPKADSDESDWNDPVIKVGDDLLSGVGTASIDVGSEFYSTGCAGDYISVDSSLNYDTFNIDLGSTDCSDGITITGAPDGVTTGTVNIQTPGIQKDCNRKYKEDESIKALQDYISTTYGGHYTSKENNVQTLDLIESVGDAESFCRSNAIKYLSRYDKKGQAKRDILKALHYTLLLYHFSGQLNETPTRGYETF